MFVAVIFTRRTGQKIKARTHSYSWANLATWAMHEMTKGQDCVIYSDEDKKVWKYITGQPTFKSNREDTPLESFHFKWARKESE